MMRHRLPRYLVLSLIGLVLSALACSLENTSNTGNSPQTVQTRPLVLILAPGSNSTYAEGVQVQFHAIAQDSLAGVTRIEFRVDDLPVGEVKSDNPSGQPSLDAQTTWAAADKRGHVITVEAFRANGSSLGMADAVIRVVDKPVAQLPGGSAGSQPPTFTPAGPAGGQSVAATDVPTPTSQPVMVASASPSTADQGILTGPVARVTVSGLNVRQGPGTNYVTVGTLAQGDRLSIVGRSADGQWWAVAYQGGTAWVLTQLVATEGDVSQVPLVASP